MRTKNLSNQERHLIAQFLIQHCTKTGKPCRGKISEVAAKFQVSRRSVTKIWKEASHQRDHGLLIKVQSKKKGKVGPKKIELDPAAIANVALALRTTLRSLATELKVSKSTVHRWVVLGLLKSHSNAIKPRLTDDHKIARLNFSLCHLVFDQLSKLVQFKKMKNKVHIDEKWFTMTKKTQRYYLLPDEVEPYRCVRSKNYIPKIMFLCAVARPIFNAEGQVVFDGKLGIFPFTKQVAAKTKSKNRTRGTLETQPIESITREVIKNCLLNQVIPSIKANWPQGADKTIYIQQDNAKPHISDDDPEFRAAASSDGFDIHIECQPAQSPDLNILDLGFFRAIQSLQTQTASYKIDELVNAVKKAYNELSTSTLNKVFLTLQSCMIEIMKKNGGNDYKIPHMNKAGLERQGILPETIDVDANLVKNCIEYLMQLGKADDIAELGNELGLNMSGEGEA